MPPLKLGAVWLLSIVPLCASVALPPGPNQTALSPIPRPSSEQAFAQLQSIVVTSVVTEGGLTGICTRTVDSKTGRYRQEFTLGINSGAVGYDGAVSWYQDSALRVRRENGQYMKALAIDQAYLFSMAYWFPSRCPAKTQSVRQQRENERVYDLVSVEPAMGGSLELWFDAETHLLSRSIEAGFYQTRTSYFSNYQPVHGILYPFSTRISNGDSRFDRLEEVQKIQLDPKLDSQLFAVPKEGGRDFSLNSAFPITIPFRLAANLIVVDVTINEKTMPFVLDSGAVNLVFPDTVKELGLIAEGQFWSFGGGGTGIATSQVRIDSMEFASAHYRPQVFSVYPFPDLRQVIGVPNLAGILGYEIFKRFVVKVDYPRHELTFSLPEAYQYSGDGIIIPIRFVGNIPEVDGSIDAIPGQFVVDIGTTGSLILYSPWVTSHRTQFANALDNVKTFKGVAGGEAAFAFTTFKHLTLGNSSFHDVGGALSLQKAGFTANPYGTGMVGAELFQKSALIFDYQRQRLILENGHE